MPNARVPSLTISLLWNDRAKCWDVVGRVGHYTATRQADTNIEADQAMLWLVVDAVRRELESQLAL